MLFTSTLPLLDVITISPTSSKDISPLVALAFSLLAFATLILPLIDDIVPSLMFFKVISPLVVLISTFPKSISEFRLPELDL